MMMLRQLWMAIRMMVATMLGSERIAHPWIWLRSGSCTMILWRSMVWVFQCLCDPSKMTAKLAVLRQHRRTGWRNLQNPKSLFRQLQMIRKPNVAFCHIHGFTVFVGWTMVGHNAACHHHTSIILQPALLCNIEQCSTSSMKHINSGLEPPNIWYTSLQN